jgi:hypothetical protein
VQAVVANTFSITISWRLEGLGSTNHASTEDSAVGFQDTPVISWCIVPGGVQRLGVVDDRCYSQTQNDKDTATSND